MVFAVVFAIFVLLMVVLAIFVTRFSIRLNRDRPKPPGGGDGPAPPDEA